MALCARGKNVRFNDISIFLDHEQGRKGLVTLVLPLHLSTRSPSSSFLFIPRFPLARISPAAHSAPAQTFALREINCAFAYLPRVYHLSACSVPFLCLLKNPRGLIVRCYDAGCTPLFQDGARQ